MIRPRARVPRGVSAAPQNGSGDRPPRHELAPGVGPPGDGFATISDDEVWLRNVHIAEYVQGTWTNHAPRRARKLLLHRAQIEKLAAKIHEGGYSLLPLSMYFVEGRVKVELGLGRGKKMYDKRQDIAKRDAQREVERYVGRRAKGRV